MKKTLFIAALLVAGVASAFAVEYTAYAEITLNKTLKLREAAEFSAAYDNGADVPRFNNTGIFAYANIAGQSSTEWIQFGTNDLEGTVLAFKVAAAGEQTMTFANIKGAQLYLVDGDKYIAIVNGGSYTFTAEEADVADWNVTRFSIAKNLPAKFINNQLVINDAAVGAEVNVTPFSFVEGRRVDGQKVTYNAPVNQALNGNYFEVEYTNKNGVARKFIVNANPTLED